MTGPEARIDSLERSPPPACSLGAGDLANIHPNATPAVRVTTVETQDRSFDMTADSFPRMDRPTGTRRASPIYFPSLALCAAHCARERNGRPYRLGVAPG